MNGRASSNILNYIGHLSKLDVLCQLCCRKVTTASQHVQDAAAIMRQDANSTPTHPEDELALLSGVDEGGAWPYAYQGTRPTVCSQLILFHRIEVQSVSTRPPVSPAGVRLGAIAPRVLANRQAMEMAAVSCDVTCRFTQCLHSLAGTQAAESCKKCSIVHRIDVGMYRLSPLFAFHAHQKTFGMALCSPSLAAPACMNAGNESVRYNQDQGYCLLPG